jgi:hypothetical protein
VQHYAVVLGKHRDNSVDECIAKYSVRIAYADDITAANGNAEVIHHVLMVITILRHIEHDPLIDSHGTVFNQHVLELLGLTTIIFNPNQLIILARRFLPVKICKRMQAFPHAPVEQDDTDLWCVNGGLVYEFIQRIFRFLLLNFGRVVIARC